MFERSFCQSDVVLGCAVCSHLCVVNYTGGQAFVVKRALVFVTAIALYLVICIGVIVGISYFLVVFVDDRFHVVHTAVANFDVILVEKAVIFVLFREVLRNKIEKCSADVSLDVFTERRVVPDAWIKKNSSSFDVTMGSYDGAEVCELVGLFILNDLCNEYGKDNIGLYRDDGLAIFKLNE